MSTRPLDGLRVIDLTRLLPGPFLSVILADLGADVIKVEAPQGGDWVRYVPPVRSGLSTAFIALNRGKRSVVLNLKTPGGVQTLRRLVKGADVLLESFRPGVMDRLGLGHESLQADNPRLIYVAITGYGQTGPYRVRAGHDLNYTALSGTLAQTGEEDGPPIMPGVQVADVAGGGLFGAVGLLSALIEREKTGKGRFIDVSMTEGSVAMNFLTLSRHLAGDDPARRGKDQLNGGVASYQVYETADGGHMAFAALEPKFFHAFCDAVDHPEWKTRQYGQEDALKSELSALFLTRTRAEWEACLAGHDACCEPILELDEVVAHPQHQARQLFFDLEQFSGEAPIPQLRLPIVDSETTDAIGPAPGLGQHTVEVLSELGWSDEELQTLRESGSISDG